MARKRRYLDETEVSKEANQVIKDKFTVNGVTYGTIPSHYTKGKIANSKTKSDITSDRVYVRQGDNGKWYQTRMDKDANNINYYLDNKALIDRSNEIIESQSKQGIGHKIEIDKADARARQQWFSNEDATKFLLTTAGLGALGGGLISAPLATTLGLAGGYGGGKLVDKGMQLGTGKTWSRWLSDKTKLPEWFTEFTNPGAIVGGSLTGLGYYKLANDWNNPYSLLSRNIRTAFANDKTPYGYNLLDPQNVLPYIKGTLNTIKGREIPLKNFEIPYELESSLRNFNRLKSWRHYLGVGDDIENLKMTSGFNKESQRKASYIKNSDGTYDYPFTADEEVMFLPSKHIIKGNKVKDDGSFITSDFILGNHGDMSGKIKYNDAGELVAEIVDTWDLNPLRQLLPKKLRPYLDLEMSKFLPAGAKPFTLKHTIPLNKFQGSRLSNFDGSNYNMPLSNVNDFLNIVNDGMFVPKR